MKTLISLDFFFWILTSVSCIPITNTKLENFEIPTNHMLG